MKLKDEEGWKKALAANQDPYGGAVMNYCREWADNMEAAMTNGKAVADVAEGCQPKGHGLSGFMYGAAVATLAHVWEYGEALRQWHNASYGAPDAKGTINPAILRIG